MILDLVTRGGLVVTQDDVGERDIGVQHGTIVAGAPPGTVRPPHQTGAPRCGTQYPVWHGVSGARAKPYMIWYHTRQHTAVSLSSESGPGWLP
jgi:hypothetical protein